MEHPTCIVCNDTISDPEQEIIVSADTTMCEECYDEYCADTDFVKVCGWCQNIIPEREIERGYARKEEDGWTCETCREEIQGEREHALRNPGRDDYCDYPSNTETFYRYSF